VADSLALLGRDRGHPRHERRAGSQTLLVDDFVLVREAGRERPDARKLTGQRSAQRLAGLRVGLQRLAQSANLKTECLVAATDVRDDVSDRGIVTEPGGRRAAKIDRRRGGSQLLPIAEDIAIAPVDAGAAAEVARVRGADTDGIALGFLHDERDRYSPRLV